MISIWGILCLDSRFFALSSLRSLLARKLVSRSPSLLSSHFLPCHQWMSNKGTTQAPIDGFLPSWYSGALCQQLSSSCRAERASWQHELFWVCSRAGSSPTSFFIWYVFSSFESCESEILTWIRLLVLLLQGNGAPLPPGAFLVQPSVN